MLGTWVNVGGIVAGSLIGLAVKKGIPEHINAAILKAEGLGIVIIGLNGILAAMLAVDGEGRISDSGGLLLLVSLVVGCLIGELLRIDDHLNNLGRLVETRMGTAGFAKGFVAASLIFPIGAMAVIGALNDGLTGDTKVLYIKSLLDFTTSIVLASALGVGVIFSAVPVLLLQGGVTLLAGVIAPYITQALLDVFCMVGYTLVMAIGINFIVDSKIKVANLLPALVIPVLYHFLLAGRF